MLREVEVCECVCVPLGDRDSNGACGISRDTKLSPRETAKKVSRAMPLVPREKLVYCTFIQRVNLFSWQQVLSDAK